MSASPIDIPLDDIDDHGDDHADQSIPAGDVTDSSLGEFDAAVADLQRAPWPLPKPLTPLTPPPARQQPLAWPGAPLTQHQLARRAAQELAMRDGRVARFPQGLAR